MDNQRFLSILNQALSATGLDLSGPAAPDDPRALQAWAAFLHACVARGATITDPRWQRLIVSNGTLRLADTDPEEEESDDFRVGLSMLMSLLEKRQSGPSN
jgi:hypothetical protein